MATIQTLRANLERDIAQLDAQIETDKREIRSILNAAESRGATALNFADDARAEALMASAEAAKAARAHKADALTRAIAIEAEETEQEKRLLTTHKTAGKRITAEDDEPAGWMDHATGRRASLGRNERFADNEVVREEAARHAERDKILVGTHGTFAQQVRSLSTGGSPGIVPTIWSSSIIDRARNKSVCLNAGVTVVPMPSKVYQIGRLNADVAPAYKTEGSAINVSDPGFDFVQLSAVTLGSLTVASLEFLADAPNADAVLQEAIAKAMALEIDRAILFGGLLPGDGSEGYNLPVPYPRGVLKTLLALAPTQVLPGSPWTNGTVQTPLSMYRELQALVFSVKRRNETPGALVSNDALYQKYADSYDSQGRPLAMPANLAALPWLTTNAINSATQGTTTTASDVFCGDWSQVLLGQRLGVEIRVLTERYAELGQVGILAYSRNDVQVARLSAMGVYRYLQAAV